MKWKSALIAAAFGVPALGLLGYGLSRDPREIVSPLPGREAPVFSLAAFTSGEPTLMHPAEIPKVDSINLSKLRGSIVVLNFWASWCLACRDEHEALANIGSRYVGTDVHFAGVIYQDTPGAALQYLKRMGPLPYPSLDDPGSRTAVDYGLYGVPETFFIDRNGRVADKHVGPVTEEFLIQKIEQLRKADTSAARKVAAR